MVVDRFADIEILSYEIPGLDELSRTQKELVYYLSEAALCGRDILWDQHYKHNLTVRRTLEAVVRSFSGDRDSEVFRSFLDYTKEVWFASGIHHLQSCTKLVPGFSALAFRDLVRAADPALLPLDGKDGVDGLLDLLEGVLFDPEIAPKRVNQAPDVDQIATSATHFYDAVTQAEVEAFYAEKLDPADPRPVPWGLNSQLAKIDGEIVERPWKVGGMYSPAIEKIVHWLEKAASVAENERQQKALELLVEFYRGGDLKTFNDYCIAWVSDTDSRVDTINGFIEVYRDPLGYRATWEAVVSFRDLEASQRIEALAANAQWFEDHAPTAVAHKKQDAVGITANIVTVVTVSGATAPATPIGINLPNEEWIRQVYGSKSVTLGNVMQAYRESSKENGVLEEFAFNDEEVVRDRELGPEVSELMVSLHEVLGHGSGQLCPGVATPKETLKSYASSLEESRADLVALYFIPDPKLVELGLASSTEISRVAYDSFVTNGLQIQLRRLGLGEDLEEAHMRNRHMVASWAYQEGRADNVIEKVKKDGKTYFVIHDYAALRELFGRLLREVQRIKSEGDYEAGRQLVETYAVRVDPEVHREVLARVATLDIATYRGLALPRLVPVYDDGEFADLRLEAATSFADQMLEYSERYGFLAS